jgi:hypothetical protein
MKKIVFSILFMAAFALGLQAQGSGCSKSAAAGKPGCCAAKASVAANYNVPQEHQAAAAKLASMDKNIEARKSENGVTYVRKETCAHSGSVAYTNLSYDPLQNTFVNVGPSEMGAAKTTSAAGCGPAKATAGKTGCATSAAGKSGCCASKAKTSTASTTVNASEGKPVKTSGGTKN